MILVAPILPSYSAAAASTFVSLGNDDYPQGIAVCSTVSECRSVTLGTEFSLSDRATNQYRYVAGELWSYFEDFPGRLDRDGTHTG